MLELLVAMIEQESAKLDLSYTRRFRNKQYIAEWRNRIYGKIDALHHALRDVIGGQYY